MTGWAVCKNTRIIASGEKSCAYKKDYQLDGDRLINFWNFIYDMDAKYSLNEIIYEDVKMNVHRGSRDNSLYFMLLAVLKMYQAGDRRLPMGCMNVMTIKKQFTGTGRADKEMIADKAVQLGWRGRRIGPDGRTINNNEADAIALAVCTMRQRGYDIDIDT